MEINNELVKKYLNEIQEMVDGCRRLGELGYVCSSGGNLSFRLDNGLILITPTKTPKRTMRVEDICIVDLDGNTVYAPEGKKPTGEVFFHCRIMRKRPDVKAIVHAHPPVLTGLAIAHSDVLELPILPEPVLELGSIKSIAYEKPISEELSVLFDEVIDKGNGFLMQNHGALICNTTSMFEAVEQLQMLESMAQSIVVAKIMGNVNTLNENDLTKLDDVLRIRNLGYPCGKDYSKSLNELFRK